MQTWKLISVGVALYCLCENFEQLVLMLQLRRDPRIIIACKLGHVCYNLFSAVVMPLSINHAWVVAMAVPVLAAVVLMVVVNTGNDYYYKQEER